MEHLRFHADPDPRPAPALQTSALPDPGPAGESPTEGRLGVLLHRRWMAERPGWVEPGWWCLPVRSEVLPLLGLAPGAGLVSALQAVPLSGTCPAPHDGGLLDLPAPGTRARFPCGCQLVLAAAWQAAASWGQVRAVQALAAAAGLEAVELPAVGHRPRVEDPGREEIAVALRTSPRSAAGLIATARAVAACPEALSLAAEGVLPFAAVRQVCSDAVLLDPADAGAVIATWSGRVRERSRSAMGPMTGQGARQCAGRLIIKAPSHRRLRARSRSGRRVELYPNTDGTGTLAAVLRQEDAVRVHRRLSALARGLDGPADARSMDAKRADLLVDLVLGTGESRTAGVEVNVIIPLAGVLGLAEGTGEVPGVGPVPGEVARALAADGRWRAWLTDAHDTVVATTPTTYRPPESLARLIRAREPYCRMPGCRTTAQGCDLDHAIPFPQGPTTPENLGPLCRRHHVLKTHSGWNAPGGVRSGKRNQGPAGRGPRRGARRADHAREAGLPGNPRAATATNDPRGSPSCS